MSDDSGAEHRCYFQNHFTSVNTTLLDQSFILSEFVILVCEPCKCASSSTFAAHPPCSLVQSLYRQAGVMVSARQEDRNKNAAFDLFLLGFHALLFKEEMVCSI